MKEEDIRKYTKMYHEAVKEKDYTTRIMRLAFILILIEDSKLLRGLAKC